jgi:hypothetical protein
LCFQQVGPIQISEIRVADNGEMQDRDLYAAILGIRTPWSVKEVKLKLSAGEVHVFLEHGAEVEWTCLECGKAGPL